MGERTTTAAPPRAGPCPRRQRRAASRPAAPAQLRLLRGKAVCAAHSGPSGRGFRAPAAAALFACRALGPAPSSGLRSLLGRLPSRARAPVRVPLRVRCSAIAPGRAPRLRLPGPPLPSCGPGLPAPGPGSVGLLSPGCFGCPCCSPGRLPAALRPLRAPSASGGGSPSAGPPGQPPPTGRGLPAASCAPGGRAAALRALAALVRRPGLLAAAATRPPLSQAPARALFGGLVLGFSPGYPRPAAPAPAGGSPTTSPPGGCYVPLGKILR